MHLRSLLLLSLPCLTVISASDRDASAPPPPAWPKVQRDMKPWSRWWWLGNIGDKKSLTSEMEKYAAVGLGGLEITPIYGVRGYEDRFIPFLSPAWMENFEHVLTEGRRLGLGLDLATGTGWPFGGPWLSDTDVAHYLAHRIYTVPAGGRLAEPVKFLQPGLVRYAGPRQTPLAELKQPITANPDLQDLALDQVRFAQPLPLVALMAFPDTPSSAAASRQPLDLTAKVDSTGHLDWTAPADGGSWTVYALFQGQHGKMVERAGPGGEGFALDHLSSTALAHYLAKFDTAFAGHDTRGLRAFFNDSYEVDDSQGEADFTPHFFEEFQRRRGYDLRAHLPELFAATESDAASRVLSDYRETVSDLLLDDFTTPWRKWAHRHGALIRNQPHGSPANILDLYAASDIPEQEGNGLLAIKFASSAAHLTGKPLASSETATWLDEHFRSTLAELKTTVDTFLLSGINHNCYHGTAFSPPDDPWPGFQFYASVELNPANPFWNDFAIVNAYVTRAQSFLQAGRPDEDVLLYYNIHDRWARRGDGRMPHFGHGRDPVGTSAAPAAAALHAAGYGFDYVSDRLLEGVTFRNAGLQSAQAHYAAIVVPETMLMPEPSLARLIQLAEEGATIVVLKQLPHDAPGLYASLQDESTNVDAGRTPPSPLAPLLAKILAHASVADGITTAPVGRGKFLIGNDLVALLAHQAAVPHETMRTLGLEFVRRRTGDGFIYFIANRSTQPVAAWVPLLASAASAALYDPMTGQSGVAAFRSASPQPAADKSAGASASPALPTTTPAAGRGSEICLQLQPGASVIAQLHSAVLAAAPWTYWQPAGQAQPLSGDWSVHFVRGGPALPAETTVTTLKSWTEFGGELVKSFSGTAEYSLHFERPAGDAPAYELDLGTLADSARVKLNGREIAALVQAPWRVVLPATALLAQNTLVVEVTNLAANRIADLDRRGVPWKKFYNVNMPAHERENMGPDKLFSAARWIPRNSGLLGPVMLTPLHAFAPDR